MRFTENWCGCPQNCITGRFRTLADVGLSGEAGPLLRLAPGSGGEQGKEALSFEAEMVNSLALPFRDFT